MDYYYVAYAVTEIIKSKALIPIISFTFITSSVYFYNKYGISILINNLAALSSVWFCLYGVSGSIWNRIMNPPMYVYSLKKRIFIGYDQFRSESYTVFVHYVGIIASIVIMIEAAGGPRVPLNETILKRTQRRRKYLYLFGLFLMLISTYSHMTLIHSKFRKYRGSGDED